MFGCASKVAIERTSIDELYRQAVRQSQHAGAFRTRTNVASQPTYVGNPDSIGNPLLDSDSGAYGFHITDDQHSVKGVIASVSAESQSGDPSHLINERFDQIDVREAIEVLSTLTGRTIILDDSVGGVVSAVIEDETLDRALQKLLLPLGLIYVFRDGAYLVSSSQPDAPLFSQIAVRAQYIPLHHPATKLVTLLPPRFRNYYQVSDERNLVMIEAPRATTQDIIVRLEELDTPVQQVILEAIVCVTSPGSDFRFGADWNHKVRIGEFESLSVGMNGLAMSGISSPQGVQNAFSDFAVTSAFVELLARDGLVTIRAAPRVTAKDGEKATISIARETFFSLQPAQSNLLFRQDIQKVEAGITLNITPRIRGDLVAVEIERAEVSEDIRSNDTTSTLSSNPYPIINRRSVSTKVDVYDGQTIVIGGLVQRQTVDQITKVPFFGDLPLAGNLFRKIEKQEQDAEVAIFISPQIVR